MAFHGFSAEGVDLLQLNRLQNSKEFYDAHKDEIKRLSIRPFHELIAEMTPEMVKIDPQFRHCAVPHGIPRAARYPIYQG